jgi:outer membrane protein
MTQRTITIARHLAACLLAGCAFGAQAQSRTPDYGPAWEVRLGAFFAHNETKANDLSGPFTPPGINIRVDDSSGVYGSLLRNLDTHWSLELAGGIPPKVKTFGKGPAQAGSIPFDGQEVATAKWFSPTLLIDYKFLEQGSAIRPYVGIGINYTRFYDLRSTPTGDAINGGPTSTKLSRSIGPVGAVGATYQFNREISLTGSYSLLRVNSHYSSDTEGVVRTTTIHFNPRVVVVALGYAF